MARARRGIGGFLQGIEQGVGSAAKTVGQDVAGIFAPPKPTVPSGNYGVPGNLVVPGGSNGVPQMPGYSDQGQSMTLPANSPTFGTLAGNDLTQGLSVSGLSGPSNVQAAASGTVTATPLPQNPVPSAGVTAQLQGLSAKYYEYAAQHPNANINNDPYLAGLHTQAQAIRNNPFSRGAGPAGGYTQAQLQGLGLLPPTPQPSPTSVQQPPNMNLSPAAAQHLANPTQALQGGMNLPGIKGPTNLYNGPNGLTAGPSTPGMPQATGPTPSPAGVPPAPTAPGLPPPPSGIPSVPRAGGFGPTIPGLPSPTTGLPTTPGAPGAPKAPTFPSYTPPSFKMPGATGGPGATSTPPTAYNQAPQTPQQAQQSVQQGTFDLNSVASQLKAATPDVQAMGAALLTQYLQALDAAQSQWQAQLQAEQKGVDPETQAMLDQLKQDVQLQRQQLMDDMNRRGLLQSGIVLEMTDRLNKNQLNAEQQLLGKSLTNILNQLNSGLLSFAQQRTGAILKIGSQTMQDTVSQADRNQQNILSLAGMQQKQDQFNQDFNLRQGEALGSINGQPTLQAQDLQFRQQQAQFNQGMSTAKFLTDATGVMYDPTTGQPIMGPDGNPLTTLKYQQMQNSQSNADRNFLMNLWGRSGQAPSGLQGYGVNPGQPSEQATAAEQRLNATQANDATRNLMQVWRDSGTAPDGLQSLGVQPGTAYYSPSSATSAGQALTIDQAIAQAQSQGMTPDQIRQSIAALGYDPTQYGY